MDNATHALAGVAIAELALRAAPQPQTRRVFMATAVAAASAPDLDLLYTGVTAAPLGYLLHHRGHSHTWPGLVLLAGLIFVALRLWPEARAVLSLERRRLLLLTGASLASHLLLDAFNVYGTHLLYPLSSRWYYGDAVFIFEPWIWMMLGACAAINARRTATRTAAWTMGAGLPLLVASAGLVRWPVLALLAATGLGFAITLARLAHASHRAAVALTTSALVFVGLFGVSRAVKAEVARSVRPFHDGALVDVISNPDPGAVWCWSVMTVSYNSDSDLVVTRRGTLSLLPTLAPVRSCASYRLMAETDPPHAPATRLRWIREWRAEGGRLRQAYEQDCWARPWLQFGRAPLIAGDRLVDLRFENPINTNFTAMSFGRARGAQACPSNLTSWEPPRLDVLRRDR